MSQPKWPMSKMDVAPENPRKSPENLKGLENSIREVGVLNPLIGYIEGDIFFVVGGQRRLLASKAVLENEDHPLPINEINKGEAFQVGLIDNLVREKMTERDVIRLLSGEHFANAPAEDIQRMIDRPLPVIKRCKAMSELPAHIVDAYLSDEISSEQMQGLVYFIKDPETLEDCFKRCKNQNWFGLSNMTAMANEGFSQFSQRKSADWITAQDYIDADGKYTRDLFSDEIQISDYDLEERLVTKAILAKMVKQIEAWNKEWGFIRRVNQIYDLKTYSGTPVMTEEMRHRFLDIENALEDGDPVTTEDEAFFKEFEGRTYEREFKKEHTKLLGIAYSIAPSNELGYMVREGVIPDDEEGIQACIDAGILETKRQLEETDEAPQTENYPSRVHFDFSKIKMLTDMNEQIKDPAQVMRLYLLSCHDKWGGAFNITHTSADLELTTGTAFHSSIAWDKAEAAYMKSFEVDVTDTKAFTASELNKALAYVTLLTYRERQTIDPELVKTYWQPDENFFSALKKDQLVRIIHECGHDADVADKKGSLVDRALKFAIEKKWFPDF